MGYLMVNLPSGHALLGAKFGLLFAVARRR